MSGRRISVPLANFTLSIKSNTGYTSAASGQCTPEQYAEAMAALQGAGHKAELLEALLAIYDRRNPETMEKARAAIAKAKGQTP